MHNLVLSTLSNVLDFQARIFWLQAQPNGILRKWFPKEIMIMHKWMSQFHKGHLPECYCPFSFSLQTLQ